MVVKLSMERPMYASQLVPVTGMESNSDHALGLLGGLRWLNCVSGLLSTVPANMVSA